MKKTYNPITMQDFTGKLWFLAFNKFHPLKHCCRSADQAPKGGLLRPLMLPASGQKNNTETLPIDHIQPTAWC